MNMSPLKITPIYPVTVNITKQCTIYTDYHMKEMPQSSSDKRE